LALAHKEGDTQVLDLVREVRPPFSPEGVVEEFSSILTKYRSSRVFGDRYAGDWPAEQFSKRGIHLEPAEKSKADLYLDLLPLVNSRAVRLLDNDRLGLQLVQLERTTRAGGKDRIDHQKGGHDDLANAAAGALVLAYQELNYSPAQRLRDNVKLDAYYKKLARGVA